MSKGVGIPLLLLVSSCCHTVRSICGDMQSFKCFNNELGRIPGLAGFMPAGYVTSLPDAYGVSAAQCSSLCLERNNTCFSFAYHEGCCFLRNITLAHPGLLCGTNVLEGRLRCPVDRFGDVFVAFGGANRIMMECMCGLQNSDTQIQWNYLSAVSYYDCVDYCSSSPCLIKLGAAQKCWVCDGNCSYCEPQADRSPVFPQRVGCMPIN